MEKDSKKGATHEFKAPAPDVEAPLEGETTTLRSPPIQLSGDS
jgi:hypothetical protein